MTIPSEKPAATTSASPKKPSKYFMGLRQLFTSKKPSDKIFSQELFSNYGDWEEKEYNVEGCVGWSTCQGCQAKIGVIREVQRKGSEKLVDNLRFEQAIEGGTGRCVKSFPTSFEAEFVEFRKCNTEKLDGEERTCVDGRKYELLWEKDYGIVECMKCNRKIEFVNHVRRYVGEVEVKWFLSSKP